MIQRIGRITLDDYERMIKEELERTKERVELIRGEVRPMSPAGPFHEEIVTYLAEWSRNFADSKSFRVREQMSFVSPESTSMPEPDIAWVKRRSYHQRRPHAEDVYLI